MFNLIKTKKDINKIRLSGKIAYKILLYINKYIKPGISTEEINNICHNRIIKHYKAYPASLNYNNFPKSICTSINDVVCHGIPNKNCILKDGDIINIDISILKNNYYADVSKMFFVGNVNYSALNLCKVTKKSIFVALKYIKHGVKLSLIGKVIQNYVENKGYSVVRDYCGHGIGKFLHEEPKILHYYHKSNDNFFLKKGMVITIEPMVNLGDYRTKISSDG